MEELGRDLEMIAQLADVANLADPWVDRIIGGVQAYNRDSEMMYNLPEIVIVEREKNGLRNFIGTFA